MGGCLLKVMEPQDVGLERALTQTLPFCSKELKPGRQANSENRALGSAEGCCPCRNGALGEALWSHTIPRGCHSRDVRFAVTWLGHSVLHPFWSKEGCAATV